MSTLDSDEIHALDDRLALVGILQELTVAVLGLFDPSRSLDDLMHTIAARFGCQVALCLEAVPGVAGRIALRGAAGLARASLDLPLPTGVTNPADVALPYPEIAQGHLTRWICPRDASLPSPARSCWLVLSFEREPRLSRQYQGMLERLANQLGLAFEHRRLCEELEQRVADRTRELEAANQDLAASLQALRQAQEQLLQAGKMAAIGQLAAGVAHEINNPLAVILGFAQGMASRVSAESPLHLPVVSIVREGLRCKALVQEMLTFSRTAPKEAEDVDLNALLEDSLHLLESRARLQGSRILLDLEGEVPGFRACRAQIQQVVLNLGNNALDAIGQGGEVVLSSRRSDAMVRVAVRDTGSGIAGDIRSRIFEPFFTTKEVGKGTGLGLSLSYEIVQQHGGQIEVESDAQGTTMTVLLPTRGPVSGQP